MANKTRTVHIQYHRGASVPLFLLWKSGRYYILSVCVCSLSYPACNSHSPYCHLWPNPLCTLFQH